MHNVITIEEDEIFQKHINLSGSAFAPFFPAAMSLSPLCCQRTISHACKRTNLISDSLSCKSVWF